MLAVVTGASEGLGRALVPLLARDGYDVMAVARRIDALEDLAREVTEAAGKPGKPARGAGNHPCRVEYHPGRAGNRALPPGRILPLSADLESTEGIEAVAAAVSAEGGNLDMLVNNAGRGDIGNFADADPTSLRGILRLNVEALTLLTRRLLPAIVEEGIVLHVASVAAVLPGPGMATYYASKAYVLSLGIALSEELRPRRISVTTVCPGPIATGFQRVAGFDEDEYYRTTRAASPEQVAEWAYRMALKRRSVAFYRWYRISDWAARLAPRSIFARLMAAYQRRRAPKHQ